MSENKAMMNKNSEVITSSADINRQMMEIKKKIQLSEGQRKAAFEDCEAERRQNFEEIQKLKTEISEMTLKLNSNHLLPSPSIHQPFKQISTLIGPTSNKSPSEIQHLLDLHIIDKSKTLDLIAYKHRKRQLRLQQLANHLQGLLSKKALHETADKLFRPVSKSKRDLQNSIHAVQLQLREATHVSARYQHIRQLLQDDSARFESKTKRIQDELHAQHAETEQLQRVMNQAQEMRALARHHLVKQEKLTLSSANNREKQAAEGKKLVNSRKQELELIEKRMFQSVKPIGDVVNEGEGVAALTDEESSATGQLTHPHLTLSESFDVLKQATGATSTEQVLERFSSQKDTFIRLVALRKQSELEKKQLENELDGIRIKLEHFKFAEVKETERKSSKMEQLENEINEQKKRSNSVNLMRINKISAMDAIQKVLRELHVCVNPLARSSWVDGGVCGVLREIKSDLGSVLERISREKGGEEGGEEAKVEERWLPAPYSGLVRRTPLPGAQGSPMGGAGTPEQAGQGGVGSEDEEDVPSRTYLKRQAQLVVDAKSRRKNIRLRN